MPARRDQVIGAASPLFRRDGYAGTSMRAVAAAVGVTAPALYRHFPRKQALLAAAIGSGLDPPEDARRLQDERLEESLGALAEVAARRDDLWLLIRRESRHLDEGSRAAVRKRLAAIEAAAAAQVATRRVPGAAVELVSRASGGRAGGAAPT